jgi:two-component system response regulator AtoC
MNENRRRILIVDDEDNLRSSLAEFLALDGFSCEGAASGEEGLELLASEVFDAAVIDLRMPGMDGLTLLGKLRESGPSLPVVMMSAHGAIADAVAAMKLGASDYLVKPFDPAELVVRLAKAIEDSRLIRMARVGERLEAGPSGASVWIGDDPAMKEVFNLVRKVAPMPSTVLVTGESGTGKEIIAREIHRQSPRSGGPFVPVNVGALPESLLESELFGFEKGAFTGADSRKPGLFELASGGTLFLDELGEMPLMMQVKLLRVLQDRTLVRVGGTRAIPVDVRIVAATNRDIEEEVRALRFRQDLYFRLNVIRIRLPALRERPLDIAPLAGMFLSRFSRELAKPVRSISPDALRLLTSYSFPGNVRELENSIERAVILCETDTLTPADFAFDSRVEESSRVAGFVAAAGTAGSAGTRVGSSAESPGMAAAPSSAIPSTSEPVSIREAEKQVILAALARQGGHRERAAAELGISRRTLLNKLKEYGIQD